MTDYQRLSNYFKYKNYSQKEVGELFGVSRQAINGILTGKDNLTLNFLKKVSEKFSDLNIDWVLNGRGEMIINQTPNHYPDLQPIVEKMVSEALIKYWIKKADNK